ncbi:DUF3558 domain-containing protein [Amycolatopsis samaneae]|uniref:DUF3558 domain-containing protein n=1 Tax=Amycolatopsis samaneae TaxID=664691 RepID=A0ABW5GLG0_9PSEU
MKHRATSVAFSCVVIAALAVGCTGKPAANPVGTPRSESPSAGLPRGGAPKVDSPMPVSALSSDPCQSALTPGQLEKILGTAPQGKPDSSPLGPACNWHNSDKGSHASVSYDTQTRTGLSGEYENTKPQAVVWRPLPPIQGFPAVAHVTPSGGEPDYFCQVSVGVADDLSFDASIILGPAKKGKVDPCQVTAQVADMVVTNLRQKAGS